MPRPNAGSHTLLYALPAWEGALQLSFARRQDGPQPLAAVGTGPAADPTPLRERRQRSGECGTVDRQELTERALRQGPVLVTRERLEQGELLRPDPGCPEGSIVESSHGARGATQARARAHQIRKDVSAH